MAKPTLPARQSGTHASPTWRGLTEPLSATLALSDAEAVETVATTTALLEEARRELPALRIAARKSASRDDIAKTIGSRFPIFPQPDFTEAEWTAFWVSYAEALVGLSAESIEAGMKAWVAKPDSRFLPKPGELKALAGASVTPTARAVNILSRATERAAELEQARRAGAREDFTLEAVRLKKIAKPLEDREAVAAMATQHGETHRQRLAARRIAERSEIRPTHGALAPGHAVTAEMLAAMHRESMAQIEERLRREASERPHTYDDEVRDVETRKALDAMSEPSDGALL